MTFNKQFMKKAMQRIDELQDEVVEKSKSISGANEYIQAKMRLYQENEKVRKEVQKIQSKEKIITETFLATH